MQGLATAWQWFKGGRVMLPSQARIPDSHVDVLANTDAPPALKSNATYFAIELNEMFLENGRKWWQDIVPTVWTSTAFSYAGTTREVPGLVGPSMLQGNDLGVPEGMLYKNSRVAGLHPYKGGPLSFSVILNQVATDNRADRVLSVVETATSSFNLATDLVPYLPVAKAVTRGLEVLLDLGSTPLMGVRDSFDPDITPDSSPAGYYALTETPVDPRYLWVRNGSLYAGETEDQTWPLRDRGFLLYRIAFASRRNDIDQLTDLTPLRHQVQEFAQRPGKPAWETAKAQMVELGVRLRKHPDLITPHADELFREWTTDMVNLHTERVTNAPKSGSNNAAGLTAEQADVQDIATFVMSL